MPPLLLDTDEFSGGVSVPVTRWNPSSAEIAVIRGPPVCPLGDGRGRRAGELQNTYHPGSGGAKSGSKLVAVPDTLIRHIRQTCLGPRVDLRSIQFEV